MRDKMSTSEQSVPPGVVIDFLLGVMPFNGLDMETLQRVAHHITVDFFPKGTRLLTAGQSKPDHLYLIQQGGVRCFLLDDEGIVRLKDYRGEGACIGALPIIRGTAANLDVETVEDTFCFLLPKEIFLDLLRHQHGFTHYYLKNFSEKIVTTAYTELRRHKMGRRGDDDLHLFTIRAGDIIKEEPLKVPLDATIQEAAETMTKYKVDSLLIHARDDQEHIKGIITDRDLRIKVVARGLDYHTPVSNIMSSPVVRILSMTTCFDALVQMMSSGLHHLAVERKNRIIGVITSHDITVLQGTSPYALFKEIGKQRHIKGLYPLAQTIPEVIRNLIKEGARASHVARMISLLNDQILERMLTLLEEELGPPPLPYCWLLMGSEGRREQTFKTDQDNAIIYADPAGEKQKKKAEEYFKIFAAKGIDHLVNCGYPLCPGEIMGTNPKWCQPISVWKNYFSSWLAAPGSEEILLVTIFFDFRGGYGTISLASELRQHLADVSPYQELYLFHLAGECLNSGVPLSFFRNFIVGRHGEQKNKLDIKTQGITPFVNFARVMALKYGVKETNTLSRLRVLNKEGHVSDDLHHSIKEAYELQMQLRLIHQLTQIEAGHLPDNYIEPAKLSDLEKRMLKDSFRLIELIQSVLKTIFPLG